MAEYLSSLPVAIEDSVVRREDKAEIVNRVDETGLYVQLARYWHIIALNLRNP